MNEDKSRNAAQLLQSLVPSPENNGGYSNPINHPYLPAQKTSQGSLDPFKAIHVDGLHDQLQTTLQFLQAQGVSILSPSTVFLSQVLINQENLIKELQIVQQQLFEVTDGKNDKKETVKKKGVRRTVRKKREAKN